MLQALLNLTAGTVAVAGAMAEVDKPYEFVSATLDGRVLVAFVDHQGTAVAVDLSRSRPEIIDGLAAGVILSDLRDVAANEADNTLSISSGVPHSEVRVDGEVRVEGDIHAGKASALEIKSVIDAIEQLSPSQRQQLKAKLAL